MEGDAARLGAAIAAFPSVSLCARPSPLQRAERFSRELGVEVWLKRDDLLGPALGGNKVRKLELLLGNALAQGADCVITCGAAQSNHARLTAACARLVGLEPYLVLRSLTAPEQQGNLLLDRLLGAHVQIEPETRSVDLYPAAERLAESLRAQGRRPYFIPVGGSVPLGD
ncbi:MAG TPA: pyridoxal-phosphate dependent enzyme, partial [Chloroflexota bacterium]|nr:pyridoxal-phosphate dependent enzyme [Chloroflexota bacterium]